MSSDDKPTLRDVNVLEFTEDEICFVDHVLEALIRHERVVVLPSQRQVLATFRRKLQLKKPAPSEPPKEGA